MPCLKLRCHAEAVCPNTCGLSVRGQKSVCDGFFIFMLLFHESEELRINTGCGARKLLFMVNNELHDINMDVIR